MNFPSRYRVRRAEAGDAQQVNQVFAEQSFEGGIAVSYLREPDSLSSFLREGDELVMLVLEDQDSRDKIVGIGACVIRAGYAAGVPCRIGYLTGLKLLREYRGKVLCIPLIYEEMHRMIQDKADIFYTTILSDNEPVQKMLEKRRKRMPKYYFLGEYHTFFCKTRKSAHHFLPEGIQIRPCPAEETAFFYQEQCEKEDFAVGSALQNDLQNADFYGLYCKGELQAVGYVLDQRHYKQYVVHHYGGIYKLLSKLPTGLLGYPDFPKPGETANCAAAGIWCSRQAADTVGLAGLLFRGMKERASQFDFLLIGIYDKDSLMGLFNREKKIDYRSRVYQVRWEGDAPVHLQEKIRLEVGFL